MDVELVAALLATLIGVLGSAFGAFLRKTGPPDKGRPEQTLEQRLTDLGDLMQSSAQILEQVQAEIQARTALAAKAKQDAEEAQHVAQLNEAQRAAVARLVRAELAGEVAKTSRRSFWQGFVINFLFFIGGAVLSVITTLWIGK